MRGHLFVVRRLGPRGSSNETPGSTEIYCLQWFQSILIVFHVWGDMGGGKVEGPILTITSTSYSGPVGNAFSQWERETERERPFMIKREFGQITDFQDRERQALSSKSWVRLSRMRPWFVVTGSRRNNGRNATMEGAELFREDLSGSTNYKPPLRPPLGFPCIAPFHAMLLKAAI